MATVPKFFVPAASSETAEGVYAEFARKCGVPVPSLNERVYSITFRHDGDAWTATVGETMTGTRHTTQKKKGKTVERSAPVSDPATVLAIFPGNPFVIMTNQGLVGNVGSRWTNPLLAGRPDSVQKFSEGG